MIPLVIIATVFRSHPRARTDAARKTAAHVPLSDHLHHHHHCRLSITPVIAAPPCQDDIGNFVLQARGAQELTKPYVCSGGVSTGRQLAAALALGAEGVNCGTRFCATIECNWPDSFKQVTGNR